MMYVGFIILTQSVCNLVSDLPHDLLHGNRKYLWNFYKALSYHKMLPFLKFMTKHYYYIKIQSTWNPYVIFLSMKRCNNRCFKHQTNSINVLYCQLVWLEFQIFLYIFEQMLLKRSITRRSIGCNKYIRVHWKWTFLERRKIMLPKAIDNNPKH